MSSTEFLDGLARIQQGIHQAGEWEHSVLLLVRPSVGEAGVIHVDEAARVWVGSTRAARQIERLRRAADAITSADEEDVSDLVAAFDPRGERVDVRQLMGFHAESAGQGSDAAVALLMVREASGQVSMSAKWQDGTTIFIEEPLGYTDALIADAAGYATEPWLDARGVKGPLRLSPARSDEDRRRGPSALLRYLRVELPGDVPMIEPFDELLAQQAAPVQVFAWLWARVASGLKETPKHFREDEQAEQFVELMDAMADDQDAYTPDMDERDQTGNPIPDIVSAHLGGIWEDLTSVDDGEAPAPRLEELINAALSAVQMFNRASPRWGLAYDVSMGHVAMMGIGQMYDDLLSAMMLSPVFVELQRLWWVSECVYRQGVALSGSHAPAFPADEMECVRLLCRMAANQPTLAAGSALQRQVSLRADRWMSLTDRSRRAIDDLNLPDDPELVEQLAEEIKVGRHFALDHVAIIEVDEMNIDRIVLAPEERADDGANLGLIGLVEHRGGTFVVSCTVPVRTAEQSPFRLPQDSAPTALTFAPAFMQQMIGEGASSLELMMLSAWRDLVVADVREQQYETEVVRKAKGKARKGRSTEVVRYLPRRVALRRAERAAREATGEPTLRRLYPVGAFAKRLPEDQNRSSEAEAYATKIGMPLASNQTVVQPHWRGGTEEDRRAAAQAADAPSRVWRSWSALDLLRTRRGEQREDEPSAD